MAGAVEERGAAPVGRRRVARRRGRLRGGPDAEADAAEDRDAQQHLCQPERTREPVGPGGAGNRGRPVEDDHGDERSERHGGDDALEIRDARETPAAAVQAEPDVDDGADGEEQAHDDREGRDEEGAAEAVEAQREREVRGDDDPDEIDREKRFALEARSRS